MPLNSIQKGRADIAEAYGYLPSYRAIVTEMCAPFWWHGQDGNGNYHIFHNGTVCFVDTGSALLAVTAGHVLDRYIEDKKRCPDVICQLGSVCYEPEKHIIDIDLNLDLAIFSVSAVVIAGAGCTASKSISWPPASVMVGDVILCGGYPGAIRKENELNADMPFQWFLGAATSSNENVVLQLELPECYVPLDGSQLSNNDLGGMSGGPIFKYIQDSVIERIELVGFIYEFQPSFGLMFARPAKFLSQYGRVAEFS